MFGSGSVTCVTSLCPAGTVGLGGPGDNAGSLFALLQASRAAAGVSSICALGLGDSRRCRQVPLRSFSGTLLTLCPGLWGGRSECDKGGSACGRLLLLVAPLAHFLHLGSARASSSAFLLVPEVGSNCGSRAWDAFLVSEGRPGLSVSARGGARVRAHGAKVAALRPPGRPAPSSCPTPVKTEAESGASPELPQDTAVPGKRCSPPGSHCFFPQQGGGQQ